MLSTDTWYFVAATNDGSTSRIYINGELTNTSNCGAPAGPTADLRIGVHSILSNNERYWDGSIDDVSIWDAVLTDNDILNLYQTSVNGGEEGLVAYWSFNSGDGSTLYDHSGNANHGVIDGAAWSDDAIIPPIPPVSGGNNSLRFDGVNDWVSFDGSVIPGSGDVTVQAWSYAPENYGYKEIVAQGNGGTCCAYFIGPQSDGNMRVMHSWQGIDVDYPYGEWVNTTVVKNNDGTKLYMNGQLAASTGSTELPSDNPFYIGTQWNNNENERWQGNIDEVRVWNIARDQESIQADLYQELNGDEEGLIGYWNFNEGEGNTLTDLSENGNDGTINGATWSGDVPVLGCIDPYAENYDQMQAPMMAAASTLRSRSHSPSRIMQTLG